MTEVSAPELVGDTWLGTGGRRLTLSDFKGRFLLLDFWTLCCVNCHHVLAELRPIESEFSDVLTVVGVHSPKFEFEKNADAVLSALHRHGIEHPILNDPEMATWRSYGVRAWPTLVLVDPCGSVVGTWSGEGHGHAIAATIEKLIPEYESRGEIIRGQGHFSAEVSENTTYLQPGKIEALDNEQVLISDSGHHRLVVASCDEPNTPVQVIGSGVRGFVDGSFADAQFNEPYGAIRLPNHLADRLGYQIIVADTANHALRAIDLIEGTVTTLAGTGEQWRPGEPTEGTGVDISLSTPWDLALFDDKIYIAMAGDHRIWSFDPITGQVGVAAGTTHEGLVDAAAPDAWFAQPSALEVMGDALLIVDSETSALRQLRDGEISTIVGTGLFDFGHIDGPTSLARLQHPLGITSWDSRVYVADTYNGSIRVLTSESGIAGQLDHIATLARGLGEPSDLCLTPDGSALLVVESARGLVTRVPLGAAETVSGAELRTIRPELVIAPGDATVTVDFTPPPGQKRDDRYGPSTQLTIGASPPELILSGSGSGTDLVRRIHINPAIPSGVLHVAAKGASCDVDSEHGACHMHQQDWGVPVLVEQTGTTDIRLTLAQ